MPHIMLYNISIYAQYGHVNQTSVNGDFSRKLNAPKDRE